MHYVLQVIKTLLSIAYINALDLYSLVRGELYRLSGRLQIADAAVAQVQQLREQGFVMLEDYYSDEQVERILVMARAHMQDGYGDFDHVNGESYYRCPAADQAADGGVFRLFAAESLQEEVRAFGADQRITDLLESAFRTRIVFNASVLQKNRPIGSQTRGFHVDMYAPKQFKAFLFLTDVLDETQGPYALIEGSHRWRWRHCWNFLCRGLARDGDVTSFNRLSPAELARTRLFKVRKGTVVVATQQAIHRGWPLTKGERFVLVNYYVEKLPERMPGYRVNRRLGYRYASAAEQTV